MWKNETVCVNCNEELSFKEKMYSHGRCPKCGYRGPNAGTVVNVYNRGYKLVRINPIWKFWKQQYKRVYREDDK